MSTIWKLRTTTTLVFVVVLLYTIVWMLCVISVAQYLATDLQK